MAQPIYYQPPAPVVPRRERRCGAHGICKSPFGRVVIYSVVCFLVLIIGIFATLLMLTLSRYFNSYQFASQAVNNVCGSSSISSLHSSAMESCAKKLAGTEYSISYVTIGNEEAAEKLARQIVESRLAACVNIIPRVTSIYMWKNKLEKDKEVLMMIKSRISRLDDLTAFIRENHPYEVCEVISMPIHHGNPPYLQWLGDTVPFSGPPKSSDAAN